MNSLMARIMEAANASMPVFLPSAPMPFAGAGGASESAPDSSASSSFRSEPRRRKAQPSVSAVAAAAAAISPDELVDAAKFAIDGEPELDEGLASTYTSSTWMATESFNMSTVNRNRTENPQLAREQFL